MSLQSAKVNNLSRLSLKGVKLPDPETRDLEPASNPPSSEEILLSIMAEKNPIVNSLVKTFDLVSCRTGEPLRKIDNPEELPEEVQPDPAPEVKLKPSDKPKLITLAGKLLQEKEGYSKGEIVNLIKEDTKVTQERAEAGFALMLQAGAVEQSTIKRIYFLGGSTPF